MGVSVTIQKKENGRYIYILILLLAGAVAFGIRWAGIEHITADFETCVIPWSAAMKTGQGPKILLAYDGDYNMPYITVLWLLNYLPGRTIVKVKLFSVLFEYLGAVAAGLIAAHFAEEGKRELWFTAACTAVLFYPSAILNGAWWGQCDFIYVAFLLYMIFALLKKRYGAAMILLGCAFSFKLQAVLILPVLLIFWWKKRSFSVAYFLLAAVMMEVLCIPAILGGYSVFIPFSVYTRQLGRYPYMYVFYPNFWALFREAPYYIFSNVAILSIIAGLGIFAVAVIRKKTEISGRQWMEFAVWSIFFMMCFLPCMHERYGMLLEVLAVIYAFINRRTWWNAVVIGLGSFIAYLQVTFGQDIIPDQWIAAAYLLSLGFFTWQMIKNWNEETERKTGKEAKRETPGVSAIENSMMDFINRYIIWIGFAVLTVLAVVVRKPMIECISADYLPNLIETEGNYHTPLYMLVMHVLSSVNSMFLPEKTLFFLVKLLCIAADLFAAAMTAVCIYDCKSRKCAGDPGRNAGGLYGNAEGEKGDRKLAALIAYGAMLFLPMVLLNSPFWAHLDSISVGLFAGAYLLYVRKREIPAGIFAGISCGLLTHYAVIVSFVLLPCLMTVKKERRGEEQTRQRRFGNTCSVVMIVSSMSGLIIGDNLYQCIVKLLYFWLDMGTWMLYPLLVLALFLCFCDRKWIPVWVLLEAAVILDWGEFLYEMPVLPHAVYILLYLAAGVLSAGIILREMMSGGDGSGGSASLKEQGFCGNSQRPGRRMID